MYPYFESIAIVKGQVRNLQHHQDRLERTFMNQFKEECPFKLESLIDRVMLNIKIDLKYKWKFLYSQNSFENLVTLYKHKSLKSFHLVASDLSYDYKFSDRSAIDKLKKRFDTTAEIIIVKSYKITDTSYSNIIFYDGNNWYTPRTPLLYGTMRASLLQSNLITLADIRVEDLPSFSIFKCINALNDLEEGRSYSIKQISGLKNLHYD